MLFFQRASERRQLPPDLVDVLNQNVLFFFSPQNSCCLKEDYLHPSRDPSFNYQESFPSVATSETHVLVLARRKESGKLYSQTTTTFVYSTARWIAQLASKLSRTAQHCFDHNKDRLVRVAKYHKEEQY